MRSSNGDSCGDRKAEAYRRSGPPLGNEPELSRGQLVHESSSSTASSTEAKEKDASREIKLAGLIEVQGK